MLGAVAPTVVRAQQAEGLLTSGPLTAELVQRAAEAAASEAEPIDDIRGSAAYRKAMVAALFSIGLEDLGLFE